MRSSLYWDLLPLKSWKLWALVLLAGAALFFLYFFGLTRTGLLGPDEPRYAAIGRAVAQTGDWITPRLWGEAWFEKPALLYWMTALGFKAGLGADLAPRLPVAIVSVGFLVYFFVVLRRLFGGPAAFYATTILATSAGWLAFSRVGVTDLPMSAAFAASLLVLLGKPLESARDAGQAIVSGALLGLALLAKGLVPLALFLPALWFLRERRRDVALLFSAAIVIAAPWYVLVTLRNGAPFLEDFFWKQHLARFLTGALEHEQPFWFYIPVLVAGIFPWTPLLWLLFEQRARMDRRRMFLLVWLLWGLLFFSIARNKLPGYLLPLLPAVAILLGLALRDAQERSVKVIALLGASAALLWLIPAIQELLPQALLNGLSHAPFRLSLAWLPAALAAAVACGFLEQTGRRTYAVAFIGLLMAVAAGRIAWQTYPQLDRTVSARQLWLSSGESVTCVPPASRSLRYGLDYYAGRELPDCH